MSDAMTVLVAVLGSSAFSIVVKEIIDSRKAKKRGVSTVGEKLEQLSRKIDERERIFSEKIDEIWDRSMRSARRRTGKLSTVSAATSWIKSWTFRRRLLKNSIWTFCG